MSGRVIADARIGHLRTVRHNSGPEEVCSRLRGRRVVEVGRAGKFLRMPLDDRQVMVAHLGMSGRFTVNGSEEAHSHFTAVLDSGDVVRLVDPRTFGFIAVYDEDEVQSSGLGRLGRDAWIDPMSPSELGVALVGRTAPIKALLLDQGIVAGLGNIYADEVLHQARIHPLRPGGDLGEDDWARIVEAIRGVLEGAIDNGGTSLDDLAYLLPDGRAGENLGYLHVYGRTGEPCPTCGTPVDKVVVRARSTHYCPECQGRSG